MELLCIKTNKTFDTDADDGWYNAATFRSWSAEGGTDESLETAIPSGLQDLDIRVSLYGGPEEGDREFRIWVPNNKWLIVRGCWATLSGCASTYHLVDKRYEPLAIDYNPEKHFLCFAGHADNSGTLLRQNEYVEHMLDVFFCDLNHAYYYNCDRVDLVAPKHGYWEDAGLRVAREGAHPIDPDWMKTMARPWQAVYSMSRHRFNDLVPSITTRARRPMAFTTVMPKEYTATGPRWAYPKLAELCAKNSKLLKIGRQTIDRSIDNNNSGLYVDTGFAVCVAVKNSNIKINPTTGEVLCIGDKAPYDALRDPIAVDVFPVTDGLYGIGKSLIPPGQSGHLVVVAGGNIHIVTPPFSEMEINDFLVSRKEMTRKLISGYVTSDEDGMYYREEDTKWGIHPQEDGGTGYLVNKPGAVNVEHHEAISCQYRLVRSV